MITVWLDQMYESAAVFTADKSGISATMHISVCEIDPYVATFRDSNQCFDYITCIDDDEMQVVLVVCCVDAVNLCQSLLKRCEELRQIASVYILSVTKSTDNIDDSLSNTTKVHGNYTDVSELCNHLSQLSYVKRYRREGLHREDFTVNPLPAATTSGSKFPSPTVSSNTIRQEADFMYSSFLRDILIKIDSTEEEMTKFCRHQCAGTATDLNVIDEFEAYYDAHNAIFWFTRDTFLFRLLNRALRELDVSTLYSLRYFIKDLHS